MRCVAAQRSAVRRTINMLQRKCMWVNIKAVRSTVQSSNIYRIIAYDFTLSKGFAWSVVSDILINKSINQ